MSRTTIVRLLASALLTAGAVCAQTTFGSIVGTVRDATGGVVAGARVQITNIGENTKRETTSIDSGDYSFPNLKAGDYTVTVIKEGFREANYRSLPLIARQTLRVDVVLEVGQVAQTVEVTGAVGIIATDSPAISSTLSPEKVASLPSNVRGAGSTSPYAMLQTLPGVQADNGLGLSIQGGVPAQSESSVDGISITQVTGNSPNSSQILSVESISEMKVQGVGNTAEYGQPGDITVTSKSGTNDLHGAAFWYHQNKALDARSFGQAVLPSKIGNTFGATLGGPVLLPKIYSGKNRTFFYFTYEGFRYPRQSTLQNTVPTSFVKQGDFSREGINIRDPYTGTPFPGNVIPASRITNIAKAILPYYPNPNQGDGQRRAASNFIENRNTTLQSDQFESRVDQTFNVNHTVFARFYYKTNPSPAVNNLLLPSDTSNNKYWQGVASWNWTLKANLINEFRFGHVLSDSNRSFPFDGQGFTNSLGLQDIQKDIFFNGLPNFGIDQYTSFNKGRPGYSISQNTQFVDNLTWVKGRHTFKFGFDMRRIVAQSDLGFTTGNNYGDFNFGPTFSGNGFADFLLGVPTSTAIAVVQRDNDGRTYHYKGYAQDTWRASRRLTIDLGVRYEFHPGYKDAGLNIANFDRTVPRTGAVIIMSDPKAKELIAPGALLSFNACPAASINGIGCTPIVTAADKGLPEGLRQNYYTQFLPRLGFAYRLNDKTTLRSSFGVYNMILLGSVFYSLTGTVQSDVRNFNNVGADGKPIFALPQTRTTGSGVRGGSLGTFEFRTANQVDFHPPYMMQWAASVDRELTRTTGLRLSFIGSRSVQMPWAPDVNQMPSSTTFFSQRPLTDRPFPNFGLVFSRDAGANALYNSFQAEVNRRFSGGLTFTGAYTLAKNLADNAGPAPSGFAGETGGGRVTNSYDRRADRGDVYATRRHRFVSTMVYQLPFGRGRRYMNHGGFADALFGGWQASSILTLQSGPFLTPTFSGGDPSGSNAPSRGSQRPDRLANGALSSPSRTAWLDRNAFLCPGREPGALQFNCSVGVVAGRDPAPIGRYGNSGVGILTGPGTFGLNTGLSKQFQIQERINLRLEGSFTNVPNWTNLGDPVLNVADNNFGRITGARGVDFGGGRTGQVSLRLQF